MATASNIERREQRPSGGAAERPFSKAMHEVSAGALKHYREAYQLMLSRRIPRPQRHELLRAFNEAVKAAKLAATNQRRMLEMGGAAPYQISDTQEKMGLARATFQSITDKLKAMPRQAKQIVPLSQQQREFRGAGRMPVYTTLLLTGAVLAACAPAISAAETTATPTSIPSKANENNSTEQTIDEIEGMQSIDPEQLEEAEAAPTIEAIDQQVIAQIQQRPEYRSPYVQALIEATDEDPAQRCPEFRQALSAGQFIDPQYNEWHVNALGLCIAYHPETETAVLNIWDQAGPLYASASRGRKVAGLSAGEGTMDFTKVPEGMLVVIIDKNDHMVSAVNAATGQWEKLDANGQLPSLQEQPTLEPTATPVNSTSTTDKRPALMAMHPAAIDLLVSNYIAGNFKDLSQLTPEQREAFDEVLQDHPEMAAMIEKVALDTIKDQDRYAELTDGWSMEMRKMLAIEIRDLINENKTVNTEHVKDIYGTKITLVLDENTNLWQPTNLHPNLKEDIKLPEVKKVEPFTKKVVDAVFSAPDENGLLQHYLVNEQGETVEINVGGQMLDHPVTDITPNNPQLTSWFSIFPADHSFFYTADEPIASVVEKMGNKKQAAVMSFQVTGACGESTPVPSSTEFIEKSTNNWFFSNFTTCPVAADIKNADGYLIARINVDLILNFATGPRAVRFVNSEFIPQGKITKFSMSGSGSQARIPDWNTQTRPELGKNLTVMLFNHSTFSENSPSSAGKDEAFPTYMMDLPEFISLFNSDGSLNLEKLLRSNKIPTLGVMMMAIEK